MIVYPAIDILDGQVVRLVQGDFSQVTVFNKDPRALLQSFVDAGATCAHLVDLSGAKNPNHRQTDLFSSLVDDLPLKIQVGGGLRELTEIESLIKAGVERVVVGSLAVKRPEVVFQAIDKLGPERLTLALDINLQNGQAMVMTEGWTENSGLSFQQVLSPFLERGLRRVLCTDIGVDGRPVGPNLDLYRSLLNQLPDIELQASGGVSRLEDLSELKRVQVHSVVIGRALLSGAFKLQEALEYAK